MVSITKTMSKTKKSVKEKSKNIEKTTKKKPLKKSLPKQAIKIETEKIPVVTEVPNAKKKKKYVMPSKSVTANLVDSCLQALEQLTANYKKKNTILEDEIPIFVELKCIKIQNARDNAKFVLPHSIIASTGEVCLVTPDIKKGRKLDHEPTIEQWEEKLRNAGVTKVKTVLPMRQLRVEYDQYELKRRLLTQHDFIMVDTRVLRHVSHILGKMFFKKHNMVIPVRINEDTLKKDIDAGLHTAMLRLEIGATSSINIGHTGMSRNELKDNILSLIKQLCTKYPGGEANIRSIALKLPLSLALPLYLTLRPSSSTPVPKLKQKMPKHFVVVEDELSTRLSAKVQVAPDGTVKVIQSKNTDSDMEDDDDIVAVSENEEEEKQDD